MEFGYICVHIRYSSNNMYIYIYIYPLISLPLKGGGTWSQTSAPNGCWVGITIDSTGTYLVAVQFNNGYIYTSTSGMQDQVIY